MQRSRSQTLYRHLPGAVYLHDDELIVRTHSIDGPRLGPSINMGALLEEVDSALQQWSDERRAGIQLPSRISDNEFVVIEPQEVYWDVWPLVFQCSSVRCGRVRRFYRSDQVLDARNEKGRLTCQHCNSRLRQVRYYSAHACGRVEQMHVPECSSCNSRENVYLEDTGSFETAAWRCRTCGNAYIRGTRMSPCRCGQYIAEGRHQAFMRQFTVRDVRTFFPQTVSFLNLISRTYDRLQIHPARARVSIASYLGDENNVAIALEELDSSSSDTGRMTVEEWQAALESTYKNLDPEDIEAIRRRRGPIVEGIASIGDTTPELLALGEARRLLERATLFDDQQIAQYTIEDSFREAESLGRVVASTALDQARQFAADVGIEHLSVTFAFPIAVAAYGFTRTSKLPNTSTLQGFARTGLYDGRTPIFAVATNTEAVLITISASRVLAWLIRRGTLQEEVPTTERDARFRILELFANEDQNPQAVSEARTLVHTLSHVFLRAIGEGQSGIGESSLAEWLVPETLTFGIYVSSFQSYTLGAMWTLLHSRTLEWLERAYSLVWRCENDPLCHQREPRACERCLFLTFGCRDYNQNLSRSIAMDFWQE